MLYVYVSVTYWENRFFFVKVWDWYNDFEMNKKYYRKGVLKYVLLNYKAYKSYDSCVFNMTEQENKLSQITSN